MKRQELKALLQDVENSGDIIDRIMEINGADAQKLIVKTLQKV